ncbi:hypothetical protein NQ317_014056 [Molorchus minor]|uniref:Uncharacterized protein n=1 Tax=Molorchus minor TaxID=1323400 RepID=A0ABQ9J215_9CUCU|nr:hypothetical protein NQ317_014056 [Molorchus minor]
MENILFQQYFIFSDTTSPIHSALNANFSASSKNLGKCQAQRLLTVKDIDGVMTKRRKRHSQHFTGEINDPDFVL